MMSSLIPSEKYSCSGSPLMLLKARTAMEGLSGGAGNGRGAWEADAAFCAKSSR